MQKGIKRLKGLTITALAVASFLCIPGWAESSWIIDPVEFHISAHGQLSCIDCHEDIDGRDLHPDPANVNKRLTDFFSYEKCLACHDEILENLEKGIHGKDTGIDGDKYQGCLHCHDPHTQERPEEAHKEGITPIKTAGRQCGECHEQRTSLPDPSFGDRECVTCHVFAGGPGFEENPEELEGFCFTCHGVEDKHSGIMPEQQGHLIGEDDYRTTSHAGISCMSCHPDSAQYGHAGQGQGDCTQCHTMHDEKVTGDAHFIVDCRACHLKGITPVKDPESKRVVWERGDTPEGLSGIHHMLKTDDEASCRTCHFKGNPVGATSMILPAKSIICMPCHTGTFSIGDTATILSLLVFLAGMVMIFSYLLSGCMRGREKAGNKFLANSKLLSFIKTMFFDVLLQRRLFRQSGARWFIHGLIFFPFLIRFLWGIIALLGSLFMPDIPLVRAMLDKNDPITAFLFDFTGLIMIIGIISALIRGNLQRYDRPSGLPEQDRIALFLIAGIVLIGFILEGMRIATTGWPEGSDYGIVGYALSLLLRGYSGLTDLYGYIWYAHAVIAGIFIAYLPFSRLIHIIFAPVVLGINAVFEKK